MAPRHEFTPVQNAAQGVGGAQNKGILITKHNSSGKLYIEKRIPLALIAMGDSRREVRAMQQCSTHPHPNIVRLITFELQTPNHIPYGSLWLQYCELGSLDALMLRYMRRGQYLADEGFAWKVFLDLALAIAYLHTGYSEQKTLEQAQAGKSTKQVAGWNPILHRDLKPSNVFLSWKHADGTGYPTVLVGDFGCAVSVRDIAQGSRIEMRADTMFEAPEAASWILTGTKGDADGAAKCALWHV
ncbi:hypothetical protein J1614_000686 [Plenodomus biglobosus]|nr:hypothetical protein J1614_000686 [Plenodomus biglobosus]